MALFTTKIQHRSPFSLLSLATKIKNHYNNAGWTVIDDQSSGSPAYIVVTKDRQTGFPGDNPIAIIDIGYYWPGIYVRTCDSWNPLTHTGTNVTTGPEGVIALQSNQAVDLWITSGDTFTWLIPDWGLDAFNTGGFQLIATGVACFERYSGDNDGGSFYGHWRSDYPHVVRVPSIRTGNTILATNVLMNASTIFGGVAGLSNVDEAGNDVMLPLVPFYSAFGKMKKQIHGIRVCTPNKFSQGMNSSTNTVVDNYNWFFFNLSTSQTFCFPVTPVLVTD